MKLIASDRRPAPVLPGPLYRALVGVGVGCALLIVTVFTLTRPVIEQKQAEALERAVFQVLPQAQRQHSFAPDPAGRWITPPPGERGARVYAGYDAAGQLVGLALEAEGMGYQDRIRLLYGYDPVRQVVVGMRVLESRETPGLGDRIEKDPRFLTNFQALDVRLDGTGQALRNPVVLVKPGRKAHPWEIDGLSGATVSARAVAEIIGASTAHRLPELYARLAEFALPASADAGESPGKPGGGAP